MSGRAASVAAAIGRPHRRTLLVVLSVAALGAGVLAAAVSGLGDRGSAAPPVQPRAGQSPAGGAARQATAQGRHRASRVAPALPARWQAGVNLTADLAGDYLAAGSDTALAAARKDLSTSVELVPTWYMADARASAIAPDAARSPTDADVLHAAATAAALGLQVLLKPQVDVLDGTYRGEIEPADRAAWFAAYRAMLLHYAALAAQQRLSGLVVGVELGTMVDRPGDTARWRSMIRAVRRAGFRGKLTYATNWDQLDGVGFWRQLDYVGIDGYFPLIPRDRTYSPTTNELVSAWHASYLPGGGAPRDWVGEIGRLERAARRPILFTELGYGATACTAVVPYSSTPACATRGVTTKPTERAQQNAYVAALRVFSRIPYVAGIFWWDWPTDANAAGDFYSPRGKAAERSVALWNAARGKRH